MKNVALLVLLGILFLSNNIYSQDIKLILEFEDVHLQTKDRTVRVRFGAGTFEKDFPLQRNMGILVPPELSLTTGYVNIVDTTEEKLLMQVPLFLDSDSIHMLIHHFPTHRYSGLKESISYSNTASNDLSLQVFINSLFFFEQYGEEVEEGIRIKTKIGSELNRKLDLDLVSRYPDIPFSLWHLKDDFEQQHYYFRSIEDIEEYFNKYAQLSDSLKNTQMGETFFTKISLFKENFINSAVGRLAPAFQVQSFERDKIDNKYFIGDPYIIAFSATWCGPCIESLPKLQAIYNRYEPKGLKVLYFNLHDDRDAWSELITQNQLTWINVSENVKMKESEITRLFNIGGIPSYILVDAKGTIVFNNQFTTESLDDLENKLEEIL